MSEIAETTPDVTPPPRSSPPEPLVLALPLAGLADAVAAGLRDFRAAPAYGLFFGGFYALGGMAIYASLAWWKVGYLAYPLAAGFAMLGPFVACGLYEVSRRREAGLPLSFPVVVGAMWAQRKRELGWMAFVSVFLFIMWLYQVRLLIALFLGMRSFSSLTEFVQVVTTTPEGLLFLGVGHVVGGALALIAFSISVVSFPLLMDRDVDFVTAIITSFRAVAASPRVMLGWGLTVAVILVVATLPMFVGLVVALPVLGHATWHIYRRTVAAPA